ncbi:MAG: hypothetical protein O3C27_02695 [Actinomycetota bacterium]|nr:hypothetical protein [Actinomycetota bacterium]
MADRQNRSKPQRDLTLVQRMGLWPLRLLWLIVPIAIGPGLMAAVADRSDPVTLVIEGGLWSGWFAGLVALLAPSAVALTAIRILAPATLAATLLAAVSGRHWGDTTLVALGAGLIVSVFVLLPMVGDPLINGSAYGSERRMALRPPAAVLLGPVQIAWLAVFVGTVTGPLLLAARQWILGIPALVVGLALAAQGVRSLHQLARRWLVFVPAGFVVHDYYTLAESLLIQRRLKPELGLAADDSTLDTLDLSGGALGLSLSVRVDEALPVALRTGRTVTTRSANRFVFTPTLPGQALAEARIRAIRIE